MTNRHLPQPERRWRVDEDKGNGWELWTTLVKLQNGIRLVFGESRRKGTRFRLVDLRTGEVILGPHADEKAWKELI